MKQFVIDGVFSQNQSCDNLNRVCLDVLPPPPPPPPGLTINKSFVQNKQSFKSVKNESLLETGPVMFSATPYSNVCGLNE